MSRIIIGDVHGCHKTLLALLAKLPPGIPITMCGDLVDRGPNSRAVVKTVVDNGYDCVKGNHEDMMLQYAEETALPEFAGQWSAFESNGGAITLKSYEAYPEDLVAHVEWMKKLPIYLEYPELKDANGRYLVVSHSNVGNVWKYRDDPERQKAVKFDDQIIWGRHNFHDNEDIYNVVGHTIQEYEPKIKSFYANIDTGAVYYRDYSEMYGRLTALQFPEMIIYSQNYIEHEVENEEETKS
jgi:serine/threonine protein phosphatase 1